MTRRTFVLPLAATPPAIRGQVSPSHPATAGTAGGNLQALTRAHNTFGLRLFQEEARSKPRQNVLISPLSVFLALAMTENGATGDTRVAMLRTLSLGSDLPDTALNASTEALMELFEKQKGVELSIANSLWVDVNSPVRPDFLRRCQASYRAEVSNQDFSRSEAVAGKINQWVNGKTKGKITDIVNAMLIAASKVILANAIYFRGGWTLPFPKRETKDGVFFKETGRKSVPMMRHGSLPGAYRSGADYEGVVLPYANSNLALCALLPHKGKSLQEVLARLDSSKLFPWLAAPDVDLTLPRFAFDFGNSLRPSLARMGMALALGKSARFSRMSEKPLFIGDVVHKTRIEVDEAGTVAAAATAVGMAPTSAPKPVPKKTLVFDRPFVVLIGERSTGAILFAGVVHDP